MANTIHCGDLLKRKRECIRKLDAVERILSEEEYSPEEIQSLQQELKNIEHAMDELKEKIKIKELQKFEDNKK